MSNTEQKKASGAIRELSLNELKAVGGGGIPIPAPRPPAPGDCGCGGPYTPIGTPCL